MPWVPGTKHDEASKKRIGLASLGRRKGKKHSKESKKKMSEARKGIKFSKEHKRKIGLASSRINKGRKITWGDKISKALTGRKISEETKKKMSESAKNKVIGKSYKYREDLGMSVRSSWEANIIRVFKYFGFNITYEEIVFELSNGRIYTPDLFIHETGEVIEIKGRKFPRDMQRIMQFRADFPTFPFEIIDKKKYLGYFREFKQIIPNWEGGGENALETKRRLATL